MTSLTKVDHFNVLCDLNGTATMGDSTKVHSLWAEIAGQIECNGKTYKKWVQEDLFKGNKYDPVIRIKQETALANLPQYLLTTSHPQTAEAFELYNKLAPHCVDPKTNEVNFRPFKGVIKLLNALRDYTFGVCTFGNDGKVFKQALAEEGIHLNRNITYLSDGIEMDGNVIKNGPELFEILLKGHSLGQNDNKRWVDSGCKAYAGKQFYCVKDGKFKDKTIVTIVLEDNLTLPKVRGEIADPNAKNIAYPVDVYGRPMSWDDPGIIAFRPDPLEVGQDDDLLINEVNKQLLVKGYELLK